MGMGRYHRHGGFGKYNVVRKSSAVILTKKKKKKVPFAWLCSETLIAANNGLGAHEEHITAAMSMQAYKVCAIFSVLGGTYPANVTQAFVLFQIAYCTSIVLIKLSIAFTFGRIITHQKGILWTLRITVGTFMAVTTSVAIYCACQCQPIAYVSTKITVALEEN